MHQFSQTSCIYCVVKFEMLPCMGFEMVPGRGFEMLPCMRFEMINLPYMGFETG